MGAGAGMAEVVDFAGYGLKATMRFLRTAMVIDDEITIPEDHLTAVPELIVAPPFADAVSAPVVPENVEAAIQDSALPAAEQTAAKPDETHHAEIAIKPLADAFLDKRIVCGVLKPIASDGTNDVVSRAVKAAEVADIVILDWYLRPKDNSLALSILLEILKGDKEQNGRLRLIVVYTSAAPLQDRSEQLKTFLEKNDFECRAPEHEVLIVANCRIRFVLKHDGKHGIPVQELPDLSINEFAKHSNGLLSNFALLGIAALREATHHLLAVLNRSWDPAFVGHRMMIGDGDDARTFAMSIFMMQIKSVLSQPFHLGSSLGDEEIGAWFDDRFNDVGIEDKLTELNAPKNDLRQQMLAPLVAEADKPKNKQEIKPKYYYRALFSPDAMRLNRKVEEIESEVSRDFSRLATYIREFGGYHPLPRDWQPRLTLGSIVRLEGEEQKFFLCLQPACDTVRIAGRRFFSFIELLAKDKSSSSVENLVVRGDGKSSVCAVNKTADGRHYAEFAADEKRRCILALPNFKDEMLTGFVFESIAGARYTWLGDISPMKAQKIAVDLAGAAARVGLDELEWLRLGGAL